MRRCDALIVGGGPAGSTCARALTRAGWKVIIADRARFPRDKVCGGWLTPEVFPLLDLEVAEYRTTGLTLQEITGFRTGVLGCGSIETRYTRVVSFAIRRCEFDDFLLRRAGACVLDGAPTTTIRRRNGAWVVNDEIETAVLVGAGGHFCPVARYMNGGAEEAAPIVAKELEFQLRGETPVTGDTPELFFSRDLEGYAWCVRKGMYLNVGIGRREKKDFAAHVREFMSFLSESGRSSDATPRWQGHAYHAKGAGIRPLVADGVLIIGDAAGLAYPESGEGIRPAIESGRLAARTLIDAGGRAGLDDLLPYDAAIRALHRPPAATPPVLQPAVKALGRLLLQRSPAFTRRVVLDRWFLRAGAAL